MIVATAGHVDHGKTALVRALTGVDTDRLPEEQRRGMTIEPGFAFADLADVAGAGGEPIAFVDVPGHERLVRQMIAGVAAVDAVLLVVAADDGPMPQTLEHLAVLSLLGVCQGAVVLTKTDRVDAARVGQVASDVTARLKGTALASAPWFAVSSVTGDGLPALREQLTQWQRAWQAPPTAGGFRLVIDRCFTQPGAGTVVTGTVLAGVARTDERLCLSPTGQAVRVRGLQVHGAAVDRVRAGQRCALNLVGADSPSIGRGDLLVAPGLHAPTQRLDARVHWLPGAPRALSGDQALHLHLGAAALPARAVPLDPPRLQPGASGWVQLVLAQPVSALRGDRFVLRDAGVLVGGGEVIDPQAPARGRARPERLADLQALGLPEPAAAMQALLQQHAQGVEWPPFARAWNLGDGPGEALRRSLSLREVHELPHAGGLRLLSPVAWQAVLQAVDDTLAACHAAQPHALGPDEAAFQAALHAALNKTVDAPVRHAALRQRLADGAVLRQGFHLRLPGHQPQLDAADQALLLRLRALMEPMGLRPPPLGELAPLLELDLPAASAALQRIAALGHLVQAAKNRFFLPEVMDGLVQVLRDTAAAAPDGRFDAASFRDRSGVGRNLTIQLLEFFDRRGLTRFANERRTLVD